jgi:hypothetical protein
MPTKFTICIDTDPHGSRTEEVIVDLDGEEILRWNVPGDGNAKREIVQALKKLEGKSF